MIGRFRSLQWISDVPRPYSSVLFRALAREPDSSFVAHYATAAMDSHPWGTDLTDGFSSRCYSTLIGVDWTLLRTALVDRTALFVVAGWNDPTMLGVLAIRRALGLPYAIFTDTPDFEWLERSRFKARLRARFLRWVLAGACRVLGTGEPALGRLAEMGADRARLVNLPYLIDANRHRQRAPLAPGAPVRLLSVGQWTARKDLATALRACARLRERGIEGFRYRLVGAGPDEAALRAEIEALGLERHVELGGWLEDVALVQAYAEADVLVHPCVFEPYGVVVLEAMASGLAVVCSDRTYAALDRVVDGESGMLFATGDAVALADRLAQLIQAPGRIDALGASARREALAWPPERAAAVVRDVMGGC